MHAANVQAGLERQQNALVLLLGLSCVGCGLSMWLGNTLIAAWLVSLILSLSLTLGALRPGAGLGPYRAWFSAALAVWMLAFAGMHLLPADTQQLIGGFPPATAVAIYVLWLAPLILVTLPYALYFDRAVLSVEDLRALEDCMHPQARADAEALRRSAAEAAARR